MLKKFAAMALIATISSTGAAAALASPNPVKSESSYLSSIVSTPRSDDNTNAMVFDVGSPYYTNLENIIASLVIEDGKAYCGSSFYQRTTKRAVLTTELQRKKASANTWIAVKKWTDEYSEKGAHLVEHSYNTTSGFQYRNYVTVKFYSGSTVIEEVSMDSPVKVV